MARPKKKRLMTPAELFQRAAAATDKDRIRAEAQLAREQLANDPMAIAADDVPHKEAFEQVRKRMRPLS